MNVGLETGCQCCPFRLPPSFPETEFHTKQFEDHFVKKGAEAAAAADQIVRLRRKLRMQIIRRFVIVIQRQWFFAPANHRLARRYPPVKPQVCLRQQAAPFVATSGNSKESQRQINLLTRSDKHTPCTS